MQSELNLKTIVRLCLVFVLLVHSINLSAQNPTDTLNGTIHEVGCFGFEEFMIIDDFSQQLAHYLEEVEIDTCGCFGKKARVSTIFGKDGKLYNTRVKVSENPVCDSIAFHFIAGLDNWLPGMSGGRFIDIPFSMPVFFDSTQTSQRKKRNNTEGFFDCTEEQFTERKEYFVFINGSDPNHLLDISYQYFRKYVANYIEGQRHVGILSNYKHKRKERIKFELSTLIEGRVHILLRDHRKDWLLYEYDLKKGRVRIPKGEEFDLILYVEGSNPKIQFLTLSGTEDVIVNPNIQEYTKAELLENLDKIKAKN